MLGCSVHTIQSVETGRLELSESLAFRMTNETGVSYSWLLQGDPKETPYTNSYLPGERPMKYTKAVFDRIQARKSKAARHISNQQPLQGVLLYGWLRSVLGLARRKQKHYIAMYRLERLLRDLEIEMLGRRIQRSFETEDFIHCLATIEADAADVEALIKDRNRPKWSVFFRERVSKHLAETPKKWLAKRPSRKSKRPSPQRRQKA